MSLEEMCGGFRRSRGGENTRNLQCLELGQFLATRMSANSLLKSSWPEASKLGFRCSALCFEDAGSSIPQSFAPAASPASGVGPNRPPIRLDTRFQRGSEHKSRQVTVLRQP